jgi:hypothetical protein
VTQPAVTEPVPIVEEETVAEVPIVDETPVRRPPAAVEPRYITEDELAGWNRGTLADYLADEGLLADASSNASYDDGSSAEYDEDGFFLDEGPNNNRSFRSRSRRDFQDDGFFFVFPD